MASDTILHSTSPTLFRLSPLETGALHPKLEFFPKINAQFSLPSLDEHASGTERLLSDLSKFSLYSETVQTDLVAPAETSVGLVEGQQIEAEEEKPEKGKVEEFWREAGNEEAGPSRQNLFQPVRTWDKSEQNNAFLSEQPEVFEALIAKVDPPLMLPRLRAKAITPARDIKTLLDLLIKSTTGSVLSDTLCWSSREGRLIYDEEKGRLQGVTRGTGSSSIITLLEIGTAVRRLEIIVDTHSYTPLTPTHHALLHAISTYLTFIKQRLASAIDESIAEPVARWNKWRVVLKDVRELANKLCQIMCWPIHDAKPSRLPSRASSLLTHIHAHLLAQLSTTSPDHQHGPITLAFAFLLQQSSQPFLTLLHQWVGLSDPTAIDTDPDEKSQPWFDVGVTRTLLPGGNLKWDYTFSAKRMPGFIPKDSRRTLFEAGKSLRALKEASGSQHPLCYHNWNLHASWGWGRDEKIISSSEIKAHVRRVNREIDIWSTTRSNYTRPFSGSSSITHLRLPKKLRKSLPPDFIQAAEVSSPIGTPLPLEQDVWDLFAQPPGSHLAHSVNPELWGPTPLDELEAFISRYTETLLISHDCPSLQLYITNHLLAPLLTHSELITRSLVSFYLNDLGLLDHLDVLRAFWLGGDVGFIERVGSALFGKDSAGAGEALGMGRRARTRVRLGLSGENDMKGANVDNRDWGIGLGLGLSERQKWPPGGAELAYALRTTLVDDLEGAKSPAWEKIEDRVSFAIKALPEDERDGRRAKWLDPQAIEALDFLYLAYSPPPAIAVLLPLSIMTKYQTIHNFILRIARCDKVIRSLYWDTIHRTPKHDEPVKVGDNSKLKSKFKAEPTSLFETDSKLERVVQNLRFRMTHFITAIAEYVLDTAISANWDIMRRRLDRLRKVNDGRDSIDSRSATPGPDEEVDGDFFEPEPEIDEDVVDVENDDGDEEEDDVASLTQLRSVHSVVLYHGVVLDRICKACLLSKHSGHQVTFKLLMSLFGLVLNLGKLVKQLEKGLVRLEEGEEKVMVIKRDWDDKEAVFLHALERLSLRTPTSKASEVAAAAEEEEREGEGMGGHGAGGEAEHDLQVLLEGERGEEVGIGMRGTSGGGGGPGRRDASVSELGELLIRLRLGKSRERVK